MSNPFYFEAPLEERSAEYMSTHYEECIYEDGYKEGWKNCAGQITLCKDCKHYVKAPSGILCCGLLHGLVKMTEDSFCSYGERK